MATGAHLEGGEAGGIQFFGRPTSINSVIGFALSVVPSAHYLNKQINIGLNLKFGGFQINTDWINIHTYSVDQTTIDYTEDGHMRLNITNLNMEGDMSGNFTDPKISMHATAKQFKITNGQAIIEVATYTDDNVHWRLDENLNVTFSDIDFTFEEPSWNFFFKHAKKDFMELLNFSLNLAEAALNGAVQGLNVMIENEDSNPDTFLGNTGGLMLNYTMTRFPEINQAKNYITINFDGRAFSEVQGKTMVPANTIWAEKQDAPQFEQLFIHETTVESWMYDYTKEFTGGIAQKFVDAVPEIKAQYGDAAVCKLSLGVQGEQQPGFVKILASTGIVIGQEGQGMRSMITASCASSADAEYTEVAKIDTGLLMDIDAYFSDWIIFAEISNAS